MDEEPSQRRLAFIAGYLTYREPCIYTRNLVKGCVRREHVVDVFCAGGPLVPELEAMGARVHVFPAITEPFQDLLLAKRIATEITELKPDLIHVQSIALADLGARIASRVGISYFITGHYVADEGARRKVEAKFLRGGFAVSDVVREAMVNESRIPRDVVAVLPSGVDTEELQPYPVLQHDDILPCVGAFGPLNREEEYRLLLDVAVLLKARERQFQMVIADQDKTENAIRKLIRQRELEETVLVLPSAIQYYTALEGVDVLVSPQVTRGLGISIMEAMAMEKPVISTASGGAYDVITDGETGFLVNKGDVNAVADRICFLLDNPREAQTIGRRARTSIEERFTLDRMTEETLARYGLALEELTNS